jgi:hypothetical protein
MDGSLPSKPRWNWQSFYTVLGELKSEMAQPSVGATSTNTLMEADHSPKVGFSNSLPGLGV